LKEASGQNAERCVIIGDEFKERKLVIKDMGSGEQKVVDYEEFLDSCLRRNDKAAQK
jgi:histidyl-tRNA synthetase